MNLYVLKYLFLLIFEGEMTSREMSLKLGEPIYNASHAMRILHELDIVKHPERRIRSWIVNSSNSLVFSLEKLLIVSKNNSEIKNLFSFPSVISIGNWFYRRNKRTTINEIMASTGISRSSVIKSLDKMSSLKIVNKKNGKPNIYYPYEALLPNLFFKVSRDIIKLFSTKKAGKMSSKAIISKIKNHESVLILIHYGSSARGKDDRFSDVDLFVVTRDRISRGEILSQYPQKHIDLSVYSKHGFLELLKKQPDFVAHITSGKVLKGKDILEAVVK